MAASDDPARSAPPGPLPASREDVLGIFREILPGPEEAKEEFSFPQDLLHYKPMLLVEAWSYYARKLDERERYTEATDMLHGAIRETFVGLIDLLNHLAIVRKKTGDTEGALSLYVHAIRLTDYFGLEGHYVIGNCAMLLLDLEQSARIPWAEQVYDLWMKELAVPGMVEEGRDTWIVEAFERLGRSHYAAIVQDLGA